MNQTRHSSCNRHRVMGRAWPGLAVVFASAWLPARAVDYTLGLSSEVSGADDVVLVDSEMFARWKDDKREVTVTLGAANIDLDYRPPKVNILGRAADLDESKQSGQLTWREGLERPLQWTFSCGAYQGFTDYRSLWLDEYYRQLFSTVPGYQDADVGGLNASIAGRYEYLKGSGIINWSAGWQEDEVSPAYEKIIFGPLLRGQGNLETWRFGIGSEHVLSPRVRFKQDAAATQSTGRAWRYAYSAETAWAMADAWTARMRVEAAREADFHAGSAALLVERDWDGRWFAGLALRAYGDNGQIIDPLLVSGAAPPLDSYLMQLTLRYSGPHATWRLAVGPYLTRYTELTPGTVRFAPLYQNRDWFAVQGAWAWRF